MIRRPVLASLALVVLTGGCLEITDTDDHVPEQRAFARTAGTFASIQACRAAKARGDYPELATCQDQILLCPDGRAKTLIGGDVIERPGYHLDADTLVLSWDADYETTATLAPDGTLHTEDSVRPWLPVIVVDGIGWELGTCATAWGP
ncbi:MAG: hypothetical protein ABI175_27335 [Polyangiales bacterium]